MFFPVLDGSRLKEYGGRSIEQVLNHYRRDYPDAKIAVCDDTPEYRLAIMKLATIVKHADELVELIDKLSEEDRLSYAEDTLGALITLGDALDTLRETT